MPDEKPPQRWDLSVHGRRHRVEVVSGSVSRTITWHVDGRLVATRRSADEHVRLKPGDGLDDESGADDEPAADPEAEPATDTGTDTGTDVDDQARADDQAGATDLGAVGVRFTTFGRPRRATWYEADGRMSASARAAIGTGGIDLDPEPGSPAALWEERIRRNPRRHAAIAAIGGVAKVVLPLLLGLLAFRLVVAIPWPDWELPSIPWPHVDLPSIPWPDWDLPSIPWPDIDLPDVTLPAWLQWVLEHAQYVVPVVVALVLALTEIRRRRRQDALRAQLAAEARAHAQPGAATGGATPPDTDDPGHDDRADTTPDEGGPTPHPTGPHPDPRPGGAG